VFARSAWFVAVACVLVVGAACSSDTATGTGDGSTTTQVGTEGTAPPGSAVVDGTEPSVPIVDPGAVEAFCALDRQLDQLAEEQLGDKDLTDLEGFRVAMATFVDGNDAVLDQYVASAPPEIRDDVNTTMDQTRAALDDTELFGQLIAGTGDTTASNRVSAFIDANCPD
jgi:hypothetical protein